MKLGTALAARVLCIHRGHQHARQGFGAMLTAIVTQRAWVRLAAAVLIACLSGVAIAAPSRAFTLTASLTPNVLGAPTNLSTSMIFDEGVHEPVSGAVVYGPAGLRIELGGIVSCKRATLENDGPSGCPAESRVGFGGGVGAVELAGTIVEETYTLDFFLAPSEHGHLRILIYASALHPVPVELVMSAREVTGPPPYGFGLAVEVPPVSTIPGATNAWVRSSYVSLGASNVAYYRTVHGARKLVHLKGLLAPTKCPHDGFSFQATLTFIDHTTSTGSYLSPCPHGRR